MSSSAGRVSALLPAQASPLPHLFPDVAGADVGGGGGVEPSADGAGLGPPAGVVSSSWRRTARLTCHPPP